jgi:salicylate hydroxylase
LEAPSTTSVRQGHYSNQTVSPPLLRITVEEEEEDRIMSSPTSAIRVAILGGGLAGATLLRGLLRYPHIAADLYESRPYLKEEGPSIDLSDTAQDVLRAIDPTAGQCLDRAGAIYNSSELRIASGPHAGQSMTANGHGVQVRRSVGWQALLSELFAGVPARMVHTDTRVSSIMETSTGNGSILTFADGTQKKYDVVIGADGIHGTTRAHVIGPHDPARKPKHVGMWGLPIQVPLARAQQFMGTEFLDPRNSRRVLWVGDGTLLYHNLLNGGRDVQIMAAARLDNTNEDFAWAKIFTPEEFAEMFSHNTSPVCQGMVKV